MHTIEYPAGETLIEAWRIPHGIATCLAPEPERGDDTKPHARAKHLHVLLEQEKALDAAFKAGRIPMLTGDRVPAKRYSEAALVAVADARAYLEPLGFELVEAVPAHIAAEYAELREQAERQKEASKAAGRYTLEEAANLLEMEAGERAGPMLDKLKAAAASGALPTYEPGKNARYAGKVVREFYEEAHAEDLNAWLEANEPRIVWRFALESLTPGAIATMRTQAAGDFQIWLATGETARRASEARGYTVKLDDLAATLHDTARDLLDAELARGAPGGNIGWWARLFACELAAQRGEALPDLGTCIEYENALAAAARSGQLTMRPPRASDFAEAVTPETTDKRLKDGLVVLKADMRAYAEQHAPGLLRSALLAEPAPKSAPAVEAATIAGPGKMGNSTKGKRAQPLSAEIEAAKREATNPDDAHSVYAVLQRWADERKAPFLGFVQGEGCKYQTPDGVEFFTLDALRKRMNRAAKTR
jgi:hypothetical protein